jgi:hypothetical protein
MKYGRVVPCFCTVLLLFALPLVPRALAGNVGACGAAAACPAGAYQCSAAGCQISVSRDNQGNVILMVNNAPYTVFCAQPGTPIQWTLSDASSFMDVRFSNGATPFTQPSVYADPNNTSPTVSIVQNPANGCYAFAVADCPLAPGSSCGYADPKVVIYPPALMVKPPYHHKKKNQN